ncbi:hypothetical protein [Ferroplasma sp.]|uniref:hypothetical protein n=1 Tax=Ferroplasma sp. TaxID=2591003 RepID=UPI0026216FE5|nr:hypothetical protein [Ferroplasma sp.]
MVTHIRINFNSFMPVYGKFKKTETDKGVVIEPIFMPLFSPNLAKKHVILNKYRTVNKYLQENPSEHVILDLWRGFGIYLPLLANIFNNVIAIDAFYDQVTIPTNLVISMKLVKKWKIRIMHGRTTQISSKGDMYIILQSSEVRKMNKYKKLSASRNKWSHCCTTKYRLTGALCGYKQNLLWCIK